MDNINRRKSDDFLLGSVLDTLYDISDLGYIPEEYISILSSSEKKLEVAIPFKLDCGEIKVFTGYFVQHSTILGPTIGSIEIQTNANMEECEALAMLMTLHTSVLGIPMGGSKGLIKADISLMNNDEVERLYKKFVDIINGCIGERNIIKLFENSGDYALYPIIDVVEQNTGSIKSVVNRPAEYFGTGLIERCQAFSISQCVKKVLDEYSSKELADVNIGVTVDDEDMDVDLLIELNNLGLNVLGFAIDEEKSIQMYREKIWNIIYNNDWECKPSILVKKINPYPQTEEESILTSNVDILVLQNPELRITADLAEKIKAKFIIEAGENLISEDAEDILEDNGVVIIPDFISLGGVLVNGYIEWVYGNSASILGGNNWKNVISNLIDNSLTGIFKLREVNSITTKKAALLYSLNRLVDIRKKKGFN